MVLRRPIDALRNEQYLSVACRAARNHLVSGDYIYLSRTTHPNDFTTSHSTLTVLSSTAAKFQSTLLWTQSNYAHTQIPLFSRDMKASLQCCSSPEQ